MDGSTFTACVCVRRFVAFGSSAPELVIAAIGASSDKTELSIPTLLASALISFGLIPACCIFSVGTVTLDFPTLCRDCLGYLLGLVVFVLYSSREDITWQQAAGLVLCYFIYLAAVLATPNLESAARAKKSAANKDDDAALEEEPSEDTPILSPPPPPQRLAATATSALVAPEVAELGTGKDVDTEEEDGEEVECEQEEAKGGAYCALQLAQRPIEVLFEWTILGGPLVRFAVIIAYLGALSFAAVEIAEEITYAWGLSAAFSGMTFLAFGAQIPDLLAAVELSRAGMADAGISQTISSQVINITIGLGLPLMLYSCITGTSTNTENADVMLLVSTALLVLVIFYIAICLPSLKWGERYEQGTCGCLQTQRRIRTCTTTLDRRHGFCFLLAFAATYLTSLAVAETDDR